MRASALAKVAAAFLDEAWREMRNDAAGHGMYTLGAINMAASVGVLTAEQAELWRRRVITCPGHDDEGGRDWCAYCGKMPATPKKTGEGAP